MITYIKKTLEYIFVLGKGKRFIALLCTALPLGLALALFVPNSIYVNSWIGYKAGDTNFISQWGIDAPINYWYALIAVFILGIIVVSIITTVVARSLRVGTFKIKSPITEMNENVFSSFFFMICMLATHIFCKVVQTLLLVFAGSLTFSNTVSLIVAIISVVAVAAGFFFIISMQLMVLPTMAINGVKLKSAALSSIRKCGANVFKIFGALAIPYLCIAIVGALVSSLNNLWISIVVDAILYAIFAIYFIVLSLIVYYEIEQIKREDYSTAYFIGGEYWGR